MNFEKYKTYWSYQLPEWDNHEKDVIEEILSDLDKIAIQSYIMMPEADKWVILFQNEELAIINDLNYGCEVRVYDEALIRVGECLVRYLNQSNAVI